MEKLLTRSSLHGGVIRVLVTLFLWIFLLPVILFSKGKNRIVPKDVLAFHKKVKYLLYSHVNGGKGMISIFLALTVSPLLLCTMIFVEYARIQSAQAIIEELMGSSIFSALAHYDPYLDERFGFMAVRQDQEESLDSLYQSYLEANVKGFGKAISLSGGSTEGKNSLIEPLVLEQEVYEYSELSVPINTLLEGLNIPDLLDNFYNLDALKMCETFLDGSKSAVNLTDSAIKMATSLKQYYDEAKKYGESLTKYKEAKKAYEDAYQAFEEAKQKKDNGEDISLDSYISDVESKAKAFGTATSDLKEKLSSVKEKERAFVKNQKSFTKATDDLMSSIDDYNKNQQEKNQKDTNKAAVETIQDPLTKTYHDMNDKVKKMLETYQEEIYNEGKEDDRKLEEQAKKLESYSAEKDGKIEGHVVLSEIEDVDQRTAALYGDLENIIKGPGEEIDVVTQLKDLLYDMLGIQMLYDGSLDSNLDPNELIHQSGVLDQEAAEITDSIVDLLSSIADYVKAVGGADFLGILTALGKFLTSVVTFFQGIFDWISSRILNLGRLIVNYDSLGRKFLLYGYGVYNMPNRTNYSDGSTLTGYDYSDIFEMAGGTYNTGFLEGDFWNYPKMDNADGSDKLYKGAELEYLLTGSNSEKGAQVGTFFNGFMLRLVTNIFAITKSDWLQASGFTGPFIALVFVILLILESLIDMILLVNKQSVSFFKLNAYMSTAGFPDLIDDITKCTGLPDILKGSIKDKAGELSKRSSKNSEETNKEASANNAGDSSGAGESSGGGTGGEKDGGSNTSSKKKKNKDYKKPTEAMGLKNERGVMELDYGEHCLILLFLGTDQEQYLKRLQNLVQLEAKEKYKDKIDYHLNKAYTGITATTKYQLNEFISIYTTGGFKLDCTKTLGY